MKRLRLPNTCPINFEFSIDNIECKVCKYFDLCLNVFAKAEKLSKNIVSKRSK